LTWPARVPRPLAAWRLRSAAPLTGAATRARSAGLAAGSTTTQKRGAGSRGSQLPARYPLLLLPLLLPLPPPRLQAGATTSEGTPALGLGFRQPFQNLFIDKPRQTGELAECYPLSQTYTHGYVLTRSSDRIESFMSAVATKANAPTAHKRDSLEQHIERVTDQMVTL
jgi:hypothetical protein